MKVLFKALLLGTVLTSLTSMAPAALAETHKKVSAKKPAARHDPAPEQNDEDVDVAKSTAVEMDCALGDKVTLYQNADDNKHIGMRWKKKLVRMEQVATTTGAQRYESTRHGLVWIGIPAKGMLLDSKKGQQLANECRTKEQKTVQATATTESQLFQETKK